MTLIEIMIVVVIMALIATGVAMAVVPAFERARQQTAESAVQTVRNSVTMYMLTHRSECPTMAQLLAERMIDRGTATTDPWDHDFRITCEDGEIFVKSAGSDGEFDTDDDIPRLAASR